MEYGKFILRNWEKILLNSKWKIETIKKYEMGEGLYLIIAKNEK